MSGKRRDEEELYTPVLLNADDPRLSAPPQAKNVQQPEDEGFYFANPLAASSDYVTYHAPVQQTESSQAQRGDFARRLGGEVVNPEMPASAPVFGVEEATSTQAPVTRANMGTEFFAADQTPDTSALAPATPMTAVQQRDAELGPGGSVLVDADQKLQDMDRARAQVDAMQAGGDVLIKAVRDLELRDAARAAAAPPAPTAPVDPNSRIGQLLSGGTSDTESKAPQGPTEIASKILSQRLAGVAGQTIAARLAGALQQTDGVAPASNPDKSQRGR